MVSRQDVLIKQIHQHGWLMGVELGLWKGQTFFRLLDAFPKLQMVGVDKWQPAKPIGPQDRETGYAPYMPEAMIEARKTCMRRLFKYKPRGLILQMDTADAARLYPDQTFDFVFIDADHTANAVERDIRAWQPKIKKEGYILGHDADWPSVRRGIARVWDTPIELLEANIWKKAN